MNHSGKLVYYFLGQLGNLLALFNLNSVGLFVTSQDLNYAHQSLSVLLLLLLLLLYLVVHLVLRTFSSAVYSGFQACCHKLPRRVVIGKKMSTWRKVLSSYILKLESTFA